MKQYSEFIKENVNPVDPYNEENWEEFDDIIVPENEIDGIYYLIKESEIFVVDSLQQLKVSSISKFKLVKRGNRIYYYKFHFGKYRNPYDYDSNYEQFLNLLKSYYPKGDWRRNDIFYLFREEDWASDRMKYIFNNAFELDFDEYEDVVKYELDMIGDVNGDSMLGFKEICQQRNLDFNLENLKKIMMKMNEEQLKYRPKSYNHPYWDYEKDEWINLKWDENKKQWVKP